MVGQVFASLRLPAGFWSRPDVHDALSTRDFGALFRLVAKYAGASQTKIAIAVGMTQSQVSTIMAGGRRVSAIDVAERALDGLDAPDDARLASGLAPRTPTGGSTQGRVHSVRPTPDTGSGDLWEPATEGDVDRRDVLRLSGAAVAGAVSASQAAGLAEVARVLTPYAVFGSPATVDHEPASVRTLEVSVALLKREYQACHYSSVLARLPAVLDGVQRYSTSVSGSVPADVHRLAAEAYQVAGSVMLKLSDLGLAAFAADRSIEAAVRSQDPLALAASARIVTHSLMQGGHAARAKEIAERAALRLAAEMGEPSAEEISVYGALLLRGAVAAAIDENRGEALRLLDESDEAAGRLGRDGNAYWTAFGPTNVAQHRVHVAMLLGDAGTAVDTARRIEVRRIPIAERKAALFIDTAGALLQWRKHEQAYHALRTAADLAPEEVRTRSSVRGLVVELASQAPCSLRQRAREFAEQVGVEV